MTWLLLGRLVLPGAILAVAVVLVWAAAMDRG